MNTNTHEAEGEMIAEWYDHRTGQEVFDALTAALNAAGATVVTSPSEGWLSVVPAEDRCEGELCFRFAHSLDFDTDEVDVLRVALRSVARMKWIDWDVNAPKAWDDL